MPFWWSKYLKSVKKNQGEQENPTHGEDTGGTAANIPAQTMGTDLKTQIEQLKKTTGNSSDIVIHEIKMGSKANVPAAVICVDGLDDSLMINENLLEVLMANPKIDPYLDSDNVLDDLMKHAIKIGGVKTVMNWNDLFAELLSGQTILLIDGVYGGLSISTRGGEQRSIEEPSTEVTVRGPREGFTESLRVNTALIRKRIKNPNLWLESYKIGEVTRTDVVLMYIKGIANDKVVEEARKRLQTLKIDAILESGYIEQLIEDKTFTIFPTIYHSERPDVVAANLLEGRFAIIVDGSPFALVAPAVFIQFFQSADDYYMRFDIATAIRFLRVLGYLISLIGPATYVAATTFHQEMIPTQLVFTLTGQREAIPFPAFVEAIVMEITFEILREAGLRLPRPIGQTVSIVGALVIGQAAVQAGLVSAAMVIVVSITAIASFATPSFSIAISARLFRFVFMLLAATFGFYGIIIGMIALVVHLCSLRSFGVPYTTPIAPLVRQNIGDTVFRAPIWSMSARPRLLSQKNIVRQGENQRPMPPKKNGEPS
ncbi:spore germination protein KA [Weizmannia acidilactici]|uniref:Spore germination protein KA n=1 Tax=Weizmannia acidilactici TaxID=2607726 RepID=A0A5J4JJ42_9BACI|nr:spore germination protein [Weizmannia acidilactici]GER70570.1 spore germination protein KA [Weizmannia acidilactici]GER73143.1 spore germination protein KA [Weizmannia acidilactici]